MSVVDVGEPERSGWLTKQGAIVKSWKRRYFVLKDGFLYYFKSENAESPQGVIEVVRRAERERGRGEGPRGRALQASVAVARVRVRLIGGHDSHSWRLTRHRVRMQDKMNTVKSAEDTTGTAFCFELSVPGRVYLLVAEDKDDLQAWLRALGRAIVMRSSVKLDDDQ